MLGVEGLALSEADRARLVHPHVGGVILFRRNFESSMQLRALTREIRDARSGIVIGVDHEGGRVQRFRGAGFSPIPAMRTLGEQWESDPLKANDAAYRHGATIGRELLAHAVDFTFAPVLDLDYENSEIIGDRAFHGDPIVVAELASAFVRGLKDGGSSAVGKHFPGHGYAAADSHVALPIDERPLDAILASDVVPFAALIAQQLPAIMPAHVVYPAVDDQPAGFSKTWIQGILRGRLAFDGLVFSDDLEMAAAHGAGDIVARADAAIAAGCDVVLVCNDFRAMDDLLARWSPATQPQLARRWIAMTSFEKVPKIA